MKKENKMSKTSVCALIWQMGLPMIVSMVLQAVYNIVDTAFAVAERRRSATKILNLRVAVDNRRRNGIAVGGYSKATSWHTLKLLSAAMSPS